MRRWSTMGRFPGRAGEEGHCRRNLDLTSRFYHVFSLKIRCFDETKHWEQSASRANEVTSHLSAHLGSHLKHVLKQIMPTLRCKHVFLWLFHFRLKKKKVFHAAFYSLSELFLDWVQFCLFHRAGKGQDAYMHTHTHRETERGTHAPNSPTSVIQSWIWELRDNTGPYWGKWGNCTIWSSSLEDGLQTFIHWLTDFSVFIVQTMNRKQKSKNKFKMSIFDQNLFWTYFKQRCIVW